MLSNIKIVGAAFGDPKSERTYSSVPKYLFSSLEKMANIVAYISTKQLRPWDFFEGAVDFSKIYKYGRPGINANWLWRPKTVDKLSARFEKLLTRVGRFNTVLQAGTHVRVQLDGVKHYCRTDMTVLQAVQTKQFSASELKGPRISEAIETQRSIFENCDGIFATSNWAKQSIVGDYSIDSQKVFVVGSGASVSSDFNINNKRPNFNILFIGIDWKRKGGEILLDAFRIIRQQVPGSKLTIIGCSPATSDPNVEVLGYLDKTDLNQMHIMTKALMDATILCVPSICEPFGICFVEAQYFGVVPITFSGEGRGQAIKDGITGTLVEERTPTALANAILELLQNPDRTREMSMAGYRFVRDELTWDRIAERVLKIIKKS